LVVRCSTRVLIGLVVGFASVSGCSSDEDASHGSAASAGNAGVAGSGGSTSGSGAGGTSGGGTSGGGTSGGGSSGRGGSGDNGGGAGKATGGAGSGGGAGRVSGAGKGSGGSAGRAGAGGEAGQAPPPAWTNATGNLAGLASECGNLTLVSATPGSRTVIAGVAKVGLFASTDRGAHWDSLGTGAGSATITNRPSSIVYDPDDVSTFWESGIYNGGGLYRTSDAGETFEQLGDVTHNDLVSLDFGDPGRKTLLVGGHEQKQTLYLSTDGGQSFEQIGKNLPAESHFSSNPLVLDQDSFLLGSCGYGDGACGIYRSTDRGAHWERASELPAQARPLVAADGTIYWSLIYDGGLARSDDGGSSWTKASDNIVTGYPVELPDGRILALRGTHVVVSSDQASTWTEVGDEIPWKPSGVAYSVAAKTLFVWHWDCGDQVLDDAIMSAGFDYTAE
jgi:hypothetical protein